MSFSHTRNSRVLVNSGAATGYCTGYSLKHQRSYAPVTVLGEDGERFVPGRIGGGISLKGVFDTDAGSLGAVAGAAVGVDNGFLVTAYPDLDTIGRPVFTLVSDLENYTVDADAGSAVPVQVDAVGDDGVDWGVSLHALGAETADGNATSVDNGAATANGGVGVLHATAFSGLTSAVVKVQHSVDNSAWNDLVTFASITAVTSERILVAAGTTVRRYLRATVDVTGTGSVTFAVAFARR